MKPTFRARFKSFICKWFGHRLRYTHDFNNQHHYICKRCGKIISIAHQSDKYF